MELLVWAVVGYDGRGTISVGLRPQLVPVNAPDVSRERCRRGGRRGSDNTRRAEGGGRVWNPCIGRGEELPSRRFDSADTLGAGLALGGGDGSGTIARAGGSAGLVEWEEQG